MGFWLWIFVLVSAVVLELLTASALVSIWFAAGAVAALIALQLGLAFGWQILIFFIVTGLFIGLCRPIATKYLRGNIVPTNADRVIGRQAKLLESISNEQWGLVKIQGVEWHAIALGNEIIEAGDLVEVLGIEGSKVIVKKI